MASVEDPDAFALLRGIEFVNDYAIIFLRPDGTIGSWNKSAQRMKGYTSEEIVGKHFSILYTPQDILRNYPQYELEQARTTGRYEDEGWRLRKDGSRFWARVIFTPVSNEAGDFLGFIKVTADLTKQRNAEKQLRMMEQGIDEVKDYAIFLMNSYGDIMTWNRGAERLFGYNTAEVIQLSFAIFYREEDRKAGADQKDLEFIKNNKRHESTEWRRRKDGTEFWSNTIWNAILDDEGQLEAIINVVRDLTEQQVNTHRYLTLEQGIEQINDYAIFLLDKEGRVFSWNKGAERIKGYTKDEVIGQPIDIFYPDDLRESGIPKAHLDWAQTRGHFEGQGWRVRKGGATFLANVVITAIYDSSTKELVGFTKVTRDLSEKQSLVNSRQSALAAAESAKSRADTLTFLIEQQHAFTTRICHEIRNPLHGIYGSMEIAEDAISSISSTMTAYEDALAHLPISELNQLDGEEVPSSASSATSSSSSSSSSGVAEIQKVFVRIHNNLRKVLSALDSIRECANHQQAIADEIISANMIEEAPVIAQQVAFDPCETLLSVQKMFMSGAIARGLSFDMNLPEENIFILSDPTHLKEILINLVSNAVKYTDRGGIQICMQYNRKTESTVQVEITVSDTGRGFDTVKLNQTPRLNTVDYRAYSSSGIGISLCKRLAKAMGSTLEWSSQEGEGTTVTLRLNVEMTNHSPSFSLAKLSLTGSDSEKSSSNPDSTDIVHSPSSTSSPVALMIPTPSGNSVIKGSLSRSLSSSASEADEDDEKLAFASSTSSSTSSLSGRKHSFDLQSSMSQILQSKKILLVEDSRVNQKIIRAQLKRAKCHIDIANNGVEALEMVSHKDYDAILMDIIMPVMNGLECARRIRQMELARGIKRRVPIIALSGNAQEVDRVVASEAGMDGYLTKPHTRTELLHKLELLFVPSSSSSVPETK